MLKTIVPHSLKKSLQSTELYSRIDSMRLASSSKRLDICAAQFAHLLHALNSEPLQGKVCMEIGSGWVLSHALICHLLGAKKVIATDIAAHAHPKNLRRAVNKAVVSVVRDVLSPFESHENLRNRLENLRRIKRFDFESLQSLGISYWAPVDLTKCRIDEEVDFAFSLSVLEHVPLQDLQSLLLNIQLSLKPGGLQAHCIHLEDHKDISGKPYEFLSIPEPHYDQSMQSERGNRLRAGQWVKLFSSLQQSEFRLLYKWTRLDRCLPEKIDPSIVYEDDEDLRITHMGVVSKRL